LAELTVLQTQLISEAWRALKPGGVLLYSTCSPHQSETTAIIERALRDFGPSAQLQNANEIVKGIAPNFETNPNRKTLQMWPHIHDTDAMFIAIITKSVS
jgi:16S rRNA (cytosine967-C5)-methyltransferase